MYWQHEYLREVATMTRNQTYRVDLPKTGLLSTLLLKISASCVSGATLADANWRLLDFLGTIEVIGNGSTIIKSLQAKNISHLTFQHCGVVPPHNWRNYATNTQFEYLLLCFGRYPGDPDYGLDLSRFDQVELRIANTATATYYGTDLSLMCLQTWKRDAPGGFQGYIRSEIWREWTTVQDETKYLLLPTEYPISGIFLRALPHTTLGMSDTGFAHLMDDVDFSLQGGTKQAAKVELADLALYDYLKNGADIITSGLADVNADRGIDVGIGRMFGWAGISGSKDGAVSTVDVTMIADATDNTVSFEAREADSPIEFMVRGYAFQNTVTLMFSKNLTPDELIDPKAQGELRLNIHTQNAAAAVGGTNQVILERVVA